MKWGVNRSVRLLRVSGATLLTVVLAGCSIINKPREENLPHGAKLTLPSYYSPYYSSSKARLLGETYSGNLDQLMDKVAQSPIGQLQFANATVSLSMGFFTYSTSQPSDERYLEVMIGMPDILDENTDVNVQINQLFSQYGRDLLLLLSSDRQIVNDKKIAGYGLNFSWRSMAPTPSGPRLTLLETVIYVRKKNVDQFLLRQIDQDQLLREATLFVRRGEQEPRQTLYVPPRPQLHIRTSTSLPSPIKFRLQPQTNEAGSTSETATAQSIPQTPSPSLQGETRTGKTIAPTDEQASLGAIRSDSLPDNQVSDALPHKSSEDASIATQEAASLPQQEYLLQLWFSEKSEAQTWGYLLNAAGYIITIDTVNETPPIRLRVSRFPSLVAATYFLDYLKAHGLQGQILRKVD